MPFSLINNGIKITIRDIKTKQKKRYFKKFKGKNEASLIRITNE